MKTVSLIFMLTLLISSCTAQNTEHYKVLNTKEYQQVLTKNKSIQLVDVRTPEEFAEGHLENAVNININSSNFAKQVEKLDKSKPVYIYCRSGGRSRTAGATLEKMGFKEIYDLKGGILYWDGKIVK
ncbi:MAG TPA: rhodanese-like domain-containing protein [Crocinitomicaceae bacterium]|nr:rhodanese-like domain-containing protein [Crocinitomicaceae bacterium]